MTDRILDFSERPASLSVRNSLLVIRFGEEEPLTVPLADLAVVIASHPQISYTHAVLSGLAAAENSPGIRIAKCTSAAITGKP